MRIRNGADFLEPVIRSHIRHFDEIVAVYNQCSDATPDILARLSAEYGDRLRVFHYLPRVYPPGSREHAKEPADSPNSLINYYNFALVQTRHQVAAKLDDDELGMEPAVAQLIAQIRETGIPPNQVWCFSGINISRDPEGRYGITAINPLVSLGDHAFFPVDRTTRYVHDRRFERFRGPGRRRVFKAFLYWHLKYLKGDNGFGNYEIEAAGNARYQRRRERFLADPSVIDLPALLKRAPRLLGPRRWLTPAGKPRLRLDAWHQLAAGAVGQADLDAAVRAVMAWQDRTASSSALQSPATIAR